MSEVRVSVYDENLEVKPSKRTKIIGGIAGILAVGLIATGLHEGDSGSALATSGIFAGAIGGLGAVYNHLFDMTNNRQNMLRRTRREAVIRSIVNPPDLTMYESAMTVDRSRLVSAGADDEVGTVAFDYTDVYKTETGVVYVSDSLDFAVKLPSVS